MNRYNAEAENNPDKSTVYLDRNLDQHNLSTPPLIVDPESLQKLLEIIKRDVDFLTSLSIMDYSLLVGVDKDSTIISTAIIDYLRPYTWDKMLETIVKSNVILQDNKEDPTVISPDAYAKRFLNALPTYFTIVPINTDDI